MKADVEGGEGGKEKGKRKKVKGGKAEAENLELRTEKLERGGGEKKKGRTRKTNGAVGSKMEGGTEKRNDAEVDAAGSKFLVRTSKFSAEERHRLAREATARQQARLEVERLEAEAEAVAAGGKRRNPLLDLGEEGRAKLFMWLRNCPYDDAVRGMLAEQGIEGVSRGEMEEFFAEEAQGHWEKRIARAAVEANALVSLVERNPVRFSSGILAALGQEAFRQIASGEVAPEAMTRMANLFLKARGDERAEQALELKREGLRREWRSATERALEVFAEEVEGNVEARRALSALKDELLRVSEEGA